MSQERSSARLLVIDMDQPLLASLVQHFTAEGYRVFSAATSQQGLALALTEHPDLILLAAHMDDLSGLETLRRLRDTTRTAHIPVMMMAGRSELSQQNRLLEEGAYDFIEKPLDLDIVALRVRNAQRRVEREGLTEPRTGLPTGRLIAERLASLKDEPDWYRIDLKIDGFGAFRDLYGFVTANEALRFAGNLILQVASEQGAPDDFVGHYNGTEEFVIITTPASGPALRDQLAQRLGQELPSFYNFMEREQGYIVIEDGAGGYSQMPLMTAHLTITSGQLVAGDDPALAADPWVDAEEDAPSSPGGTPDAPPPTVFEW